MPLSLEQYYNSEYVQQFGATEAGYNAYVTAAQQGSIFTPAKRFTFHNFPAT